ncbi:MAG: hypothetical protein MK102_11440 [Fuerstiella sp.]|nr:hypothetical protein [Fuerstiella sp.]
MLRQFAVGSLVFAVAMMFAATQAEDAASKKFSAKCPISGGKAKEAQSADFKGGKVYFCCGKCKAAFEKDSTKHTAKAHAQLVATGQYEQKKCPLTGGPMKTTTTVGGLEVKLCCGGCKKKVEKAEGADQLALVFSDSAFKKAFVKKK